MWSYEIAILSAVIGLWLVFRRRMVPLEVPSDAQDAESIETASTDEDNDPRKLSDCNHAALSLQSALNCSANKKY